jgi:hypothetical protein
LRIGDDLLLAFDDLDRLEVASRSTPILDLGRSRTWPTEAFTVKLRQYLPIVRALAGDSTTTSASPA